MLFIIMENNLLTKNFTKISVDKEGEVCYYI